MNTMKRFALFFALLFLLTGTAFSADQTIKATEEMVGSGHATKTDTLNRLTLVEHNTDGTHKALNISPTRPAFLAYLSASANNVTGDNTTYTIICDTEVYDQGANYNNGTGIFTAPVTGRYNFSGSVYVTGCTISTSGLLYLVTTNRTYFLGYIQRAASALDIYINGSTDADMDVGETAYLTMSTSGEAGKTDDIYGTANLPTKFSGHLIY